MKSCLKRGVAAGALLIASAWSMGAYAQSTGTAEQEELVVTGSRGPQTVNGLATVVETPKARSIVEQQYLSTQQPGQSVLQSLNLQPAVNFTNNDAYGNSGGDLVVRGLDAARLSLTEDGVQLNDTGNYAIYSNQQLDPELIDHVTVNLGTTDVDSPTASATGGTINYVSIVPGHDFRGFFQPTYGSDDYLRLFGMVETGDLPGGLRGWASASYTNYDKFRGPGELEKQQYNFRLYKDLNDNGDFISLAGHYNINRNNFYRRVSVDNFNAGIIDPEYDNTCARPTAGAGTVENEGAAPFSACSNYYGVNINPSNTGNLRGTSRFTLRDNLHLTIDPQFQYTLANGGGTTVVSETDARLQGSTFGTAGAKGVDLNGDGDTLDSIRLFSPSNTNTHRYSVNASLIWDVSAANSLRLAYTFDYGRHRQTGEYAALQANGDPENVFGGHNGTPILTASGDVFQKRDRFSIAELNQVSAQYVGRFMADALIVNVGVRAPFFHRELNNYCFQEDTFNAYCAPNLTEEQVEAIRAKAVGAPVSFTRDYNRVLPNVGLGWRFAPNQQLFASYAENLSAPRTDDLYDRIPADPDPEISRELDVGYRYQSGMIIGSVQGFYSKFQNYILRTLDNDPITGEPINRSINVGDLKRWGFDGQLGVRPTDKLSLYATASYISSTLEDDIVNPAADMPNLQTEGNELPEVPNWQFGGRAQYDIGGFSVGLQGKWVDKRWTNVVNDEETPSYVTVDADIRYDLAKFGWERSFIQLNVQNLFDENYLADISTEISGNRTANLGAPRTITISLRAAF